MDNQANLSIETVAGYANAVINEVEKAVLGKREVLQKMMAAFLTSGGHILLEDFPGLAKTLISNCFAQALGLEFKRVQFTPDILPGDISGGYYFDHHLNQFVLRKGSLFTNILLADEINRASPKTQSALLEAMQEGQVSLEGESHPLPEPFIVVATQNPIEYEGTFPLPEAQLDRFLIRLSIGYPSAEEEQEILSRRIQRQQDLVPIQAIVNHDVLLSMRQSVETVFIESALQKYIIDLVTKTRQHRQIELGVSPRGSLALLKLARAWAAIHNRDYVLPDDIKTFAAPVMCHRIIVDPNLWGNKKIEQRLIDEVVNSVSVPVLPESV